jgi:hypothetical protein
MKTRSREVVKFGDTIQLFHVKSGKYLRIYPDKLAKDERQNLLVNLNSAGDTYSWLTLLPRFKVDHIGDPVVTGTELYLSIAERPNEFIHCSERDPLPGKMREVNCSLEATSWKIVIFQNIADAVEAQNNKLVLTYQIVYINDPEQRCNLSIQNDPLESLDGSDDDGHSNPPSRPQSRKETPRATTPRAGTPRRGSVVSSKTVTPRKVDNNKYTDVLLEPMQESIVHSRMLWFVENEAPGKGGPVKWKDHQVRLRHLNTNKYLQAVSYEALNEDGHFEEMTRLTTTSNPEDKGTLFTINEINSPRKLLALDKPIMIMHKKLFFERGDVVDSAVSSFQVRFTDDRGKGINLKIYKHTEMETTVSSDEANNVEPSEVFSGLALRKCLQKYFDMTVIPRTAYISTVWPNADRGDVEFFNATLERAVFFSQGFPISATNIRLDVDKASDKVRIQRQNLLCDQGVLEVLLRLIHKLTFVSNRVDNSPKLLKSNVKMTEEEQILLLMGKNILSKCFNLILHSVRDNPDTQMYVADHMTVLLAHLSGEPLAGMCVTEMLANNMELQETKIGNKEIAMFVEKLRSSKMNAMYLRLLTACCSCQGDGVDGNQCKVAETLYSNTADIIIQMHADYARLKPVKWNFGLYITESPVPGSPLLGERLVKSGIPTLSLAWTTNSIDFSPLGLFGKLSVGVHELYAPPILSLVPKKNKSTKTAQDKKKAASMAQKAAVASYFVAQMMLGGEMCMDRNYVAFHTLDEYFPYEVLVSILKMDVTEDIMAAALRLLLCLHVDRDPQAETPIPSYTRTWAELTKGQDCEPRLPYVEPARRHTYGLVQQYISDHLRYMEGRPWTELSRYVLQLLRKLIQFNFYGSNERMKDIIEPLVRALDRRHVQEVQAPQGSLTNLLGNSQTAASGGAGGDNTQSNIASKIEPMEIEGGADAPAEGKAEGGGGDESSISWGERIRNMFNRAARVLNSMAENIGTGKKAKTSVWEVPARYAKCPQHELQTMIESVEILKLSQTIIDDRNLTLLLNYFYKWENSTDTRTPSDLFRQAIEDSQELSLGDSDVDHIMVDVLMFVSPELVQSTLELLMAFHSSKRSLLNNVSQVQLLVCNKRERQYKIVDQMLQQLERNAETHELWGCLATEVDQSTSKQTKDIMKELADICRLKCDNLTFDTDYKSDPQIQDLFRNLGCFGICMKVLNLFDSIEEEEDGTLGEVSLNTRALCLHCNQLLVWFFKDNVANQDLGYSELEFFVDSLDGEIQSHRVIEAIFSGNEKLMRLVPHSYIIRMVEKIRSAEKDERSPYDLELLMAISSVNSQRGIKENQIEIMKHLTSPGNVERVSSYFVPLSDPEYNEKLDLMAPCMAKSFEMKFDDMPRPLQYHVKLLDTFSSMTVGRANGITAIEAKLQSLYEPAPLIEAILDPASLLLVKIKLIMFLYNGIIDVELKIPGFEYTQSIWKLLVKIQELLASGPDDFMQMRTVGLGHKKLSRVKLEYHIVNIMVVLGFFTTYFDSEFSLDDLAASADTVTLTTTEVYDLIAGLYRRVDSIYRTIRSSRFISKAMKDMMTETLSKLKTAFNTNNPNANHASVNLDDSMVEEVDDYVPPPAEDDDEPGRRRENAVSDKYSQFIHHLAHDEDLQRDADLENTQFIAVLESLPFVADEVQSDIRQETLFKKLVTNINDNITYVNNERRLSPRLTKTAIWVMQAFRTMIENRMGMTIFERDEDGGLEQDIAVAPVISALNACGATTLLLDLISVGIDAELQLEAIKLGVAVLFKEGGALEVQKIFNTHLNCTQSHYFFRQVHNILVNLMQWHKQREFTLVDLDQEVKLPDNFLVVRFIQLMSEGHYLPNQEIVRAQPHNPVSINLLDDFAEYLEVLSRFHCRTSTYAGIRVAATVLEVIQGPCKLNQQHLVMRTDLVETLNRLLRGIVNLDCVAQDEIELKKTAIDIFQGLLEGQPLNSAIYERILNVIHMDIIMQLSGNDDTAKDEQATGVRSGANGGSNDKVITMAKKVVKSEEEEILETECIVLLQMLCDCKPSLRGELGLPNPEEITDKETACVEIVWNNEVHRRFFHVPDVCQHISKSSMDAVVEYVDRTTLENKLTDFLERSQQLYREIKHHEFLLKYNLTTVFSKKNFDKTTTFSFLLALVINGIFLFSYTAVNNNEPHVVGAALPAVNALNYVQVIVAFYNLLVLAVVINPVKYETLCALGSSHYSSLLWTVLDPLTIYYMGYMIMSLLGVVLADYYLSFLLLDILMKNSTARNIMMSIYQPRKQLMYVSLLVIFICYIYSFFYVSIDSSVCVYVFVCMCVIF